MQHGLNASLSLYAMKSSSIDSSSTSMAFDATSFSLRILSNGVDLRIPLTAEDEHSVLLLVLLVQSSVALLAPESCEKSSIIVA
jgi:hypothetical protein